MLRWQRMCDMHVCSSPICTAFTQLPILYVRCRSQELNFTTLPAVGSATDLVSVCPTVASSYSHDCAVASLSKGNGRLPWAREGSCQRLHVPAKMMRECSLAGYARVRAELPQQGTRRLADQSGGRIGTRSILLMCCSQVIGVWGDIGHTPNSTDTRNHLLSNNPEIVYNTADFVYAGAQHQIYDSTWT